MKRFFASTQFKYISFVFDLAIIIGWGIISINMVSPGVRHGMIWALCVYILLSLSVYSHICYKFVLRPDDYKLVLGIGLLGIIHLYYFSVKMKFRRSSLD